MINNRISRYSLVLISFLASVLLVGVGAANGAPSSPSPQPPAADKNSITSITSKQGPPKVNSPEARAAAATVGIDCPSRMASCTSTETLLYQINNQGATIGQYRAIVSLAFQHDRNSLRSTMYVFVSMSKELVTGVDGGTFTVKLNASEKIRSTGPQLRQVFEVATPVSAGIESREYQLSYYTRTMMERLTYADSQFSFKWTYTIPPNTKPIVVSGLQLFGNTVRCDNADGFSTSTPGCVNPDYWPTVTYSHYQMPLITDHISDVQAVYGYGSDTPLHRVNSFAADENNRASCSQARINQLIPERPIYSDGDTPSCDEYPFASTYENQGEGDIRWVPLKEQRIQGGNMLDFYSKNRIINYPAAMDAFWVETGP
ncbi:hypothetical protein KXR83_25825 [Williamsia muralis]|uniref:NucA/NucB deoxyribonuclease domain-containing protein n=1 Tax=Williamsia marianensis TaxID=85044 RepID=UPI003F1493DF